MREYGRHIQKMVDFLLTLEDRNERQHQTKSVIELMGLLNPHLKNVEDFRHMLWDHLFFISDFKLDVDSPYPIPSKETYKAKPDPMDYPKRHPKYAHLGKNLEIIINKALSEENPEKRVGFANSIAYYMKLSYSNWHKELVHDDAIRAELNNMTNGELEFSATPYIKHRPAPFERDDYGRTPTNNRRNFSGRNNTGGSSAGRSNTGGRTNDRMSGGNDRMGNAGSGLQRNSNNRNNNNNNSSSNNRNSNSSNNNRPNNFKKRF